jgi:hypothetical protein
MGFASLYPSYDSASLQCEEGGSSFSGPQQELAMLSRRETYSSSLTSDFCR